MKTVTLTDESVEALIHAGEYASEHDDEGIRSSESEGRSRALDQGLEVLSGTTTAKSAAVVYRWDDGHQERFFVIPYEGNGSALIPHEDLKRHIVAACGMEWEQETMLKGLQYVCHAMVGSVWEIGVNRPRVSQEVSGWTSSKIGATRER